MTEPWDLPDFDAHEAVHFLRDPETGVEAIVALHSTHLGPGAGGARFRHYADRRDAITDALRLSRGMSYKNAMAGLPLGGGKAVILADAAKTKTPELIAAFARMIDTLGGRYVTAQDVGMSEADMIAIGQVTPYVSGLPASDADGAGGDPGPHTARGVFLGVKAAVQHKLGRDSLAGVHVAIQGVGSVGGGLARHLAAEGAKISLADIDSARAEAVAAETGATVVGLDQIMTLNADVLSPNALGAILTEESIAQLNVPIVAGGANNQLATPEDGQRLFDRNILYTPDYVINAGGIINVGVGYCELGGAAEVDRRIDQIPGRLVGIWQESEAAGVPPGQIADNMARALLNRA